MVGMYHEKTGYSFKHRMFQFDTALKKEVRKTKADLEGWESGQQGEKNQTDDDRMDRKLQTNKNVFWIKDICLQTEINIIVNTIIIILGVKVSDYWS